MTVWIVFLDDDDGNKVIGVYASPEKAESAKQEEARKDILRGTDAWIANHLYTIGEYTVQ